MHRLRCHHQRHQETEQGRQTAADQQTRATPNPNDRGIEALYSGEWETRRAPASRDDREHFTTM